jgi:hypothetical protein
MDLHEATWEHGLDLCGSGWGEVEGFCEYRMKFRIP